MPAGVFPMTYRFNIQIKTMQNPYVSTSHCYLIPSLWGQMGPNCQVESICAHIFVRHFHILIIFDHMIANGDTKKSINPNDLDWPWMTLKWHKKTFFSQHIPLSITLSGQNCLKMKNLLSYDFEQGTLEYIYKRIGTKSTKMIFFFWRSKLTYAFSLLLPDMLALPRWQPHNWLELKVQISF